MPSDISSLLDSKAIPYQRQVSMAARTTLQVGGAADYLVEAHSVAEITGVMRIAHETGTPLCVVGNGSNLLVRDGGIRGIVLSIGARMSDVEISGHFMHAQAGVSVARLSQIAQAAGLASLAELSGIPGTIGGAIYMNAGAYGAEVSQLLATVDAIDPHGELHCLARESLSFEYRKSGFMDSRWIIARATLSLSPGDPIVIAQSMRDYAARRREKQPLNLPSAGSFFKRPEGYYASALIDQAKLKGVSVGGARVSEKHAGFLVNTGNAIAKDFLDLMALVTARVFETTGVILEPEVQILGCDLSC